MTTATDDYCLNCEGENPQLEYDNICYECYIKKYPNLDTGMEEYPNLDTGMEDDDTDEEEEEEEETEWEFRVRVGAIKQEDKK
jgi:hypothetical protein